MPDTIYKLTDQDMRTYGGYQWGLGKARRTDGSGALCGSGWLHCYSDPLLAEMLNPIHANINHPRCFVGRGGGRKVDDKGLKAGYTWMCLDAEVPVLGVTTEQRCRFAILCALAVYDNERFAAWAHNWLTGADRSEAAAGAAERAAWAAVGAVGAAGAAAWAAAGAAANQRLSLIELAAQAVAEEQPTKEGE